MKVERTIHQHGTSLYNCDLQQDLGFNFTEEQKSSQQISNFYNKLSNI